MSPQFKSMCQIVLKRLIHFLCVASRNRNKLIIDQYKIRPCMLLDFIKVDNKALMTLLETICQVRE